MPCETSLCLTLLLIESKPLWRRPCHTQIVRSHMRAAFLPSLGAGQEELKLARSLQSSSHSGHCSKWNHSIFRVTVRITWAISGFSRKTASLSMAYNLINSRPFPAPTKALVSKSYPDYQDQWWWWSRPIRNQNLNKKDDSEKSCKHIKTNYDWVFQSTNATLLPINIFLTQIIRVKYEQTRIYLRKN